MPDTKLDRRDGADLILDTVDRFAGQLVLLALGPLTNVAIALERDRARLSRVARLVVMGGAVTVPGNVTPAAEFNFFADPDAAAAVLAAGLPVELVPLDVTRRTLLTSTALRERLRGATGRRARFVLDVTARAFALASGAEGRGIPMHDPLAAGVVLDPSLVRFERLHVEVECEGRHTSGMSLADRRPGDDSERAPANCAVATARGGRAVPLPLPGARVPSVCVIASVNVDYAMTLPRLPGPGETVLGGTLLVGAGGKGANQAVAARKLGAEVRVIGAIGDDTAGAGVRRGLDAIGIDTAAWSPCPAPRPAPRSSWSMARAGTRSPWPPAPTCA